MTIAADHHIHLFSPGAADHIRPMAEATMGELAERINTGSAAELVRLMDADGVEKALVLSVGYLFAMPELGAPNLDAIAAENDWTADQAAQFPDRLFAACSVNPLTPGAVAEIDRCGASGRFVGLKLHLANAGIDLRHADHLRALGEVFSAADANGLAITVHLRNRRPDYGVPEAQVVVERLMPLATGVPVHIAHMAGWGGYDARTDAALGVFASWAAANTASPLYFDIAIPPLDRAQMPAEYLDSAESGDWIETRFDSLATHIRNIGLDRILFGTDWPIVTPRSYLDELRKHVPLTADEFGQLERTVAPWLVPAAR